jgi:hypothetical protein
MRPLALCLLTVALAPAARAQPADAAPPETPAEAEAVVRAFVEAYNRHDVAGMLALADTAVVWLSVAGDSVVVEARGAAELARGLEGYFRDVPSAASEVEAVTALGPWVAVRERARWTGEAGPRAQAALSVYEVRDGRVRRVWYYPVVR